MTQGDRRHSSPMMPISQVENVVQHNYLLLDRHCAKTIHRANVITVCDQKDCKDLRGVNDLVTFDAGIPLVSLLSCFINFAVSQTHNHIPWQIQWCSYFHNTLVWQCQPCKVCYAIWSKGGIVVNHVQLFLCKQIISSLQQQSVGEYHSSNWEGIDV